MNNQLKKAILINKLKQLSFRKKVFYPFLVNDRIRCGEAFLSSIKGKYAGRRGFVIGNGPSLLISDLSRLTSEITIASNKIFLAFKHTEWRPSYVTICDPLVWQNTSKVLHIYCPEVLIPSYLDKSESTSYCHTIKVPKFHCFSLDYTVGFHPGATVTFFNLQLAVHLGLNPIYIIGCDHYYKGEANLSKSASEFTVHAEDNHFIEGYREKGELIHNAPIDLMNRDYLLASKIALLNNVQIINSTRGGFLNAFPRVDIDSLI